MGVNVGTAATVYYENIFRFSSEETFRIGSKTPDDQCGSGSANYAVVGTPNRLEYDQSFFVKNGDGSADLKPIAHLYKTQVYALARYLELPEEVRNVQPTTDTYSMVQGQDEFYFALPYHQMDIALLAYNHHEPACVLAKELCIGVEQVEFIYRDIEAKRKTTAMLHWPAIPVEMVSGPNTKPPVIG